MSNMKSLKLKYIHSILCLYIPTTICFPHQEAQRKSIIISNESHVQTQRKNLIKSIMNASISELEQILKAGINPKFYFELSPDAWVTPLQAALLKRNPAIIDILLKSPLVDLTYRLPYEYSNLEFAVLYLSIPLARLLLQQGTPPIIDTHIMRSLYKSEAPNGKSQEMIHLLKTYKQHWQAMQEFVKVQYCPDSPAYAIPQYILKKIFFEHILTTS